MTGANTNHAAFVVLGASGGIGSALCRRLRSEGARLYLLARDEERLSQLAGELESPFAAVDAVDWEAVVRCFSKARATFGQLEGVVNCVGSMLLKPAHTTSTDEWNTTILSNLGSAFATVRAAAKEMLTGGSVVLLSSAAARVGLANHEAIAAAKAGIEGLARSAAATYASRGLRFNVVAPGLVRTPLSRAIWENEVAATSSEAMHALGRLGEPDDIAAAIAWLLNPANDWITGQVIGVDGGLASVRPRVRQKA
ncbi:MAG: SDR family NAD(P)-dependent oxidoreductase [Planctomycetota bacterium]